MSKKMVLKVDVVGDGCKAQAMSSVAKLEGVKSMAVDGEKGTLTVVGDVDVVRVAKALRKAKFDAHVLSFGPEKVEEKKPDPPAKKPADEPKPPPPCCAGCSACRPHPVPAVAPFPGGVVYYEQQPEGHGCVIL
ncbi:heavy metal-associated isoprenylated plant protein 2-like [Phragmites australis]|uniref:heavy metal-associated isoprenylated plant protein 2-like n=1 Tax=Phragmites australis TaxID=29695 RepID=UPI002D796EE6|nr:heavy metal-associated isoprenylated plant protein 2-like [Phragmites australis]